MLCLETLHPNLSSTRGLKVMGLILNMTGVLSCLSPFDTADMAMAAVPV
jgi:hypothetical protein